MLSTPFKPFSHSGSLFKPLNHTFLTVIPKTPFPDEVIHFRPISLCNVIYKTISKILVNKLKPFMDSLISPFQNAFKKGRSISNNILIAHEIMDILRKKKGRNDSFGALKIDMKKAYDRVSWNFLRVVLTAKNFSRQWINWLMECVTSIQYTLLVNGSRSKSFKPCKGLRQGDPLSPYLFLMCVNVLSLSLQKAKYDKLINGVKVGRNGCTFTHLLFADDSLFFFKKDNKSVANLKRILDWYCKISRQDINFGKSDLYCSPNMPLSEQEDLARQLHVNLVQHPSKYLGINFNLRGNRVADFQFLVDKLQSKLEGWKANLLSQAGRTTIINFVL